MISHNPSVSKGCPRATFGSSETQSKSRQCVTVAEQTASFTKVVYHLAKFQQSS